MPQSYAVPAELEYIWAHMRSSIILSTLCRVAIGPRVCTVHVFGVHRTVVVPAGLVEEWPLPVVCGLPEGNIVCKNKTSPI